MFACGMILYTPPSFPFPQALKSDKATTGMYSHGVASICVSVKLLAQERSAPYSFLKQFFSSSEVNPVLGVMHSFVTSSTFRFGSILSSSGTAFPNALSAQDTKGK